MYVAHERRAYILRLLEQHGHLRSADLALDLGVTDETIRTDLVALQKQGLLQRVHGGARYVLPTQGDGTTQSPDALMADILAARIQPGMCLYLDAAPFSLVLAWKLRDKPCRLITASPKLLVQLGAKALAHRIFCPGGELEKTGGLFSPDTAQDYLQSLAPDAAILRPASLTPEGPGYADATQAAWAQAAARCAKHCYITIPSADLAAQAAHTFPCQPDLIVTEDNLPPGWESAPHLHTVPYISRDSLLPTDRFDY